MTRRPANSSRRALLLILLATLGLRVILLDSNYTRNPDHFHQDRERIEEVINDPSRPSQSSFGYEVSNVAYALVCGGEGFASPFGGRTGPTAWVAPGVVLFYSVGFQAFGCFAPGAILSTYLLAMLISLGLSMLVYRIGCRFSANPTVGLVAALLFALSPIEAYLFWLPSQIDFNLLSFSAAALFLSALAFLAEPALRRAAIMGAVAGCSILFSPGFLLCAIACFGLCWLVNRDSRDPRYVAAFILAQLIIVGPWIVYQRSMLGGWTFVKSNAPFELFAGNTATASGLLNNSVFRAHHPSQNVDEFMDYRNLGELPYVKKKLREFVDGFRPGAYVRETARRFLHYFFLYNEQSNDRPGLKLIGKRIYSAFSGVVLLFYLLVFRRQLDSRTALLYAFVGAYALPYVLTANMTRYTIPILPLLLVPLSMLLCRMFGVTVGRRGQRVMVAK